MSDSKIKWKKKGNKLMEITVRRYCLNDMNDMRTLYNEKQNFRQTDNDINRSTFSESYFKRFIENEKALPLVVEIDNKIVGFCVAYFKKPYGVFKTLLTIDEFCIDHNYIDVGVDKAILEELKLEMATRDVKKVEVVVVMHRKAVQFFKNLGFKQTSSFRSFVTLKTKF